MKKLAISIIKSEESELNVLSLFFEAPVNKIQ